MSIKSYQDVNGKTLYRVYVNIRSKSNQGLRSQRKLKGIKTQKEALKRERELIRICEREILEKESFGETWQFVVDSWEAYLLSENKLQPTTQSDYVSTIRKHTEAWMKRAANSIRSADVREVLNQLKAYSKSISYQNTVKVIINRVFNYGIENGLIEGLEKSPAFGISLGRVEQKKPEILTIQEIQTLLKEAKNLDHEWYPVWAVALLTGLRNGELYALNWADVDWENRMISITKSYNCRRRVIKSTKSGDWRTVPISSELGLILKEIKLKSGKRKELLPRLTGWSKGNQARVLRQFCIGIGLPPIKFHTLRACFATQLIRNGVPPIQIQKICGWKDLETMQRYVRLAGIEIDGVTESLKVLPEKEVAAKVVGLFQDK